MMYTRHIIFFFFIIIQGIWKSVFAEYFRFRFFFIRSNITTGYDTLRRWTKYMRNN